jgi:AI-2E family transporter
MLDDMPERRRRDMLTPLLLSLAVILLLAFWFFKPFILVFAVSACVALLLAPAQKRFDKALGGKPTLAAALLVLLTTVVILIPILTSLFLLARQTALFLDWIRLQPLVGPEEMQRFWDELPRRYPGLKSWIAFLQAQITPILSGGIAQLAGGANGLLQNVLGRVTHAAIDLGLFLLMLFFLLRDGGRLKKELRPISPFSEEQEHQIFDHLERTIKGALQAVVVVPVIQGILAMIGFVVFGRDPRGDRPARRLAARLDAGVRLPLPERRDGARDRARRLLHAHRERQRQRGEAAPAARLGADPPAARLPLDHRRRAGVRRVRLPDRPRRALAGAVGDPHLQARRAARRGVAGELTGSAFGRPIHNRVSGLGYVAGSARS